MENGQRSQVSEDRDGSLNLDTPMGPAEGASEGARDDTRADGMEVGGERDADQLQEGEDEEEELQQDWMVKMVEESFLPSIKDGLDRVLLPTTAIVQQNFENLKAGYEAVTQAAWAEKERRNRELMRLTQVLHDFHNSVLSVLPSHVSQPPSLTNAEMRRSSPVTPDEQPLRSGSANMKGH